VQIELANEKRRIKEAKRMQRLAMRKPGDDDDEEEEEEEEDAEEEAEEGVVVPKHPLTVLGESLLGDCNGSLIAMTSRQISRHPADITNPKTNNYDVSSFSTTAVVEVVGNSLVNLCDWIGAAKESVGIDPNTPITPAYQSPYTHSDAAKAWKALLAPDPEPEEKGGKKGGGKPKAAPAAKKGKGDKNAPLTPELIAEFYGKAHEIVKKELLDMVERVFEVIDTNLEMQSRQIYRDQDAPAVAAAADDTDAARSMSALTNPNSRLHEVSCVAFDRSLVAGKIVLQTFDGFSFVPPSHVTSAYPVVKLAQKKALEPVLVAAQNGAAAVVLLYESNEVRCVICPRERLTALIVYVVGRLFCIAGSVLY
jgi:hypothetical protein